MTANKEDGWVCEPCKITHKEEQYGMFIEREVWKWSQSSHEPKAGDGKDEQRNIK